MTDERYKNTITRLIRILRNNKNLPFTIPLYKCPSNKLHCKQHHGEIIMKKYVKKTATWLLEYYSIHEKEVTFVRHHDSDIIKKHLKRSFKKRLLKGDNLVHLFPQHEKDLHIRVSEDENKMLMLESEKMNLSLSDYIRKMLKLDLIRDQKS